jgi:hypothetical protein
LFGAAFSPTQNVVVTMLVFHGYFGEVGDTVTAPGGVMVEVRGRDHSGGRESVMGNEATGVWRLVTGFFRTGGGSGPAAVLGWVSGRVAIGRNLFSFGSLFALAMPYGAKVASEVASMADARQKRLRFCFMKKVSHINSRLAVRSRHVLITQAPQARST